MPRTFLKQIARARSSRPRPVCKKPGRSTTRTSLLVYRSLARALRRECGVRVEGIRLPGAGGG